MSLKITADTLGVKGMARRAMGVDDSATFREALETTSTQAEDNVEAVDERDAFGEREAQNVDMLATDLNMSNPDGIKLTGEIRQKPGYRFMPRIMWTTQSQPETKKAGKPAGAPGWIIKPFSPEQLLAVVRMVYSL